MSDPFNDLLEAIKQLPKLKKVKYITHYTGPLTHKKGHVWRVSDDETELWLLPPEETKAFLRHAIKTESRDSFQPFGIPLEHYDPPRHDREIAETLLRAYRKAYPEVINFYRNINAEFPFSTSTKDEQ